MPAASLGYRARQRALSSDHASVDCSRLLLRLFSKDGNCFFPSENPTKVLRCEASLLLDCLKRQISCQLVSRASLTVRPNLIKVRTSNPQYLTKMIFLSQQKFYVTIRERKPLDEIGGRSGKGWDCKTRYDLMVLLGLLT